MKLTSELIDLWAQLMALLVERAGTGPRLRPGASDARIAALETAVGVRFPDDIRASLRVHDGEEPGALRWLPAGSRLLPVDDILAAWRHDTDAAPRRVSLTRTGGDGVCCDLIPGQRGMRAQLVLRVGGADRAIQVAGWRDLLKRYTERLLAGRLVFAPDDHGGGAIVPADGGELGDALVLPC